MAEGLARWPRRIAQAQRLHLRRAWTVVRTGGPGQVQFWFIALFIGVTSGFAAMGFRLAITLLQGLLYGADDINRIHSHAAGLPWWQILLLPTLGGLLVGLLLTRFTPDGRVRTVADVIEGAALRDGLVEVRAGLASAAASLITLSSGGSSGREGPVVHIAAMISTWVSRRIEANGLTARELLGCAVAAAVSASFNAPIAGALFAMEVVLRHFAVHAFAPIAIASVAGTVINRMTFGDITEFTLHLNAPLSFYVELPAFLLLGLVSGLIAVVLMRSIFLAEDVAGAVSRRLGVPPVLRPAVSGAMLGAIAIPYPHVIGVGYETTVAALSGDLTLATALVFVVVKVVAVAITMGGRMGGGVFSPALMVGALSGLVFGIVAVSILPQVSGGATLYALAGMGAVAAAVLGAPISTTLIVFELTGDWETGLAVMVSVSLSTALASRLVNQSFFLTQLERRGVRLAAGPQAYLLTLTSAALIMRAKDSPRAAPEAACQALIAAGVQVAPDATLEVVLPLFDRGGHAFVPVVAPAVTGNAPELLGAVFQVDALRAYNRALAARAAEEHG